MSIVSKWPISPYIKGVIIHDTLNRSWENSKNKKEHTNYRKNEPGSKGLRIYGI